MANNGKLDEDVIYETALSMVVKSMMPLLKDARNDLKKVGRQHKAVEQKLDIIIRTLTIATR